MSTEELLKPRYKVIATWPGMHAEPFHLGQIISLQPYEDEDYKGFIHIPIKHIPGSFMREGFFSGYPHLFKKMEWFEERTIEEMPEYVKVIREDCIKDTGLYCKVFRWTVFDDKFPTVAGQYGAELEGYTPLYLVRTELNFAGQVYGRLNAFNLQPATIAEYEQYINQKEKQ